MSRPPRPQDDNRDDVDKHGNDDDGEDNNNHRRAVETNVEERDGADFYLVPFNNTTIRYVLAAMV